MASPARGPPLWTLIQSLRNRAHDDDFLAVRLEVPESFLE